MWAIVAGLVLVAVLMALLTWRYWRRTQPGEDADEHRDGDDGVAGGAAFTVPAPDYGDEPGHTDDASDASEPGEAGRRDRAGVDPGGKSKATSGRGEPTDRSTAKHVDPLIAQLAAEAAGTDYGTDDAAVDDNARRPRRSRRTSRYADLEISVPPPAKPEDAGDAKVEEDVADAKPEPRAAHLDPGANE
ncbi:MAG: hypothetical protein ABI276_05350 [Acidimicrobiales bacterium]